MDLYDPPDDYVPPRCEADTRDGGVCMRRLYDKSGKPSWDAPCPDPSNHVVDK